MRVLAITEKVRAEIDAAIAKARAHPVGLADVMSGAFKGNPDVVKLEDRKPTHGRTMASEHVLIPVGYRASISFEQQPPGLCRHLSISVDKVGMMPSREAVDMIAEAFGITHKLALSFWLEEFAPGHYAVNIVAIDADAPAQGSG